MTASADTASVTARRAFRPLRVMRVVPETDEAVSFVLDLPEDVAQAFRYEAGQFVTLRVSIDGDVHYRSYSMSSSPTVDPELQITVKRVPGGLVSNWLIDNVGEGRVIMVSPPAGSFVLSEAPADIVAFAAGSGITPVFSILKSALRTSSRHVRLLCANRDLESAIFRTELEALVTAHPGRLTVEHHADVHRGFVGASQVTRLAEGASADAEYFICGPGGFMHVVEEALHEIGIEERVHIERFTPNEVADIAEGSDHGATEGATTELTISCDGRTVTVEPRSNNTILQTARAAGLRPPSSCEAGSCATCMALVVEGHAEMRHNEVLTDEEIADGWVVTCQALPVSPLVRVVYE